MKKIISLTLAIIMITTFMVGCAPKKKPAKEVDLKEVQAAIKEEFGEDYYPSEEINMEMLKDITGIDEADIETIISEVPLMSVSIDTFIAIKAKEGKGDAIETALEKYRKYYQEDALLYPMNIAKAHAAKVVRHGDYVFYLMFGKHDDRQEATEEERLEFAKAEIQRAEDVINKFFK